MPQRLRRATWPAIALACMLALALSFVLARPGGGTERSDPAGAVGPTAISGTEPVSAPAAPRLGRARELPELAREAPKPKPPKRKRAAARPAAPAPAPAAPAAPAPTPAPAAPEPAYTPPPEPVAPSQPAPEPAAPPAPQADPPPVYFDDSG